MITLDERVYEGLLAKIGRRRIGPFIESLVRPHVVSEDLEASYAALAADEAEDEEALDWADALIGDVEGRSPQR